MSEPSTPGSWSETPPQIVSVPAPVVMVSLPSPPKTSLSPSPALILSSPAPPSITAMSPLPTPGTFGNMLLEESKNWRVAFEAGDNNKNFEQPKKVNTENNTSIDSKLDYSFDFEE